MILVLRRSSRFLCIIIIITIIIITLIISIIIMGSHSLVETEKFNIFHSERITALIEKVLKYCIFKRIFLTQLLAQAIPIARR